MRGIDWGYGKIPGKAIKDAGFNFVCRYLSRSPGKNLDRHEIEEFRKNGLEMIVVWETTENRALQGFNAGVEDALDALREINDLGLSGTQHYPPIFFACDNDFSQLQQPLINHYFEGIATKICLPYIGVYGSYDVVRRTLDAKLATYAWQTYAWSHGKWDPRALLRQVKNGTPTIHGVQCDTNEAIDPNFGQFK